MERKYNDRLVAFAAELRNDMTKEEKHLWYDYLRTYPLRFSRQKILGKYIADFYCAKVKLIIELDGSQHYEKDAKAKDIARTNYLKNYNISVLRFTNNEINENFKGVCEYIDLTVKKLSSGN